MARDLDCADTLTIRRDEVEARVLQALQEKLLRQDLFQEFCDAAEREIERIEARREKLIEMVMEGVPPSEVKDELTANEPPERASRPKAASE